MRTYAPASTEAVLARLLDEPSLANAVVHHEVLPAREAITAPFPAWLDARIVRGLEHRGITSLYAHQAEAIEAVHAGEDIVVVTPTASGKTLCYALPVLQALAEDPSARALFLFPTKALGQDQVAEFSELARSSDLHVAAATYDGDTPAPIRSAIRSAGQVVVTNPDMLHSAILPHHTKWFQLFEQVQVIVIDELHTYRGVFGSHVANALRRLLRLCHHYGSNPIIVCSSATIGNPAELAALLTGRTPRLIDRNGAPAGERHVLLVDPPLLDPATGARGSALTHAQRWALPFLRAGRQTIVFGRARVAVEIILTGLREALREHLGPRSRIRGYRGGYLPTERRAIEHGLRDGEVLGVVSTNALELGVDIGALDVSILAGYPGSIAGTWQQLGRAGRRRDTSVGILVASGSPVDQYVIHHPEFILAGSPEEARVDPDNLHVLLAHLRCATFEKPFDPGEVFGPGPVDELLAFIAEEGHLRQAADGRWYWSSENFPASEVSLRTAAPENVVIIDTTPDRPRVIGEVDLFAAQVLVHTQAIYLHESVQYHVDKLDWGERKAYVRKVDVDYYTYANRAVTLKPLDVFASADATGGRRVHGEVMVASLVTLFKKLKFGTDENVGWGPIDLPELELQTTAYWLTFEPGTGAVIRAGGGVGASGGSPHVSGNTLGDPPRHRLAIDPADGPGEVDAAHGTAMPADRGVDRSGGSAHVLERMLAEPPPGRLALDQPDGPGEHHSGGHQAGWRRDELDVALMGAGRAIQAVAAVLLMVDPRDLGLVTQVRSPHQESPTIYLYEAVPGGVGLSERLFTRHAELVSGARELIEACGCDSGCPACTGPRLDPEIDAKALALRLLDALSARAVIRADRGVGASGGSARVSGTLADAPQHRRALHPADGPVGSVPTR